MSAGAGAEIAVRKRALADVSTDVSSGKIPGRDPVVGRLSAKSAIRERKFAATPL
jgi:hypothetical protein